MSLDLRYNECSDQLETPRVLGQRRSDNIQQFENWWPEPVAEVLGLPDMDIISLDHIQEQEVKSDLRESKVIGLSILSFNKIQPIVVCLTTKSKIFVINTKKSDHLAFLKSQLERNNLRFYTVDGAWDGDMMNRCFDIRLKNHIDLIAFDIHNSIEKYIPQNRNDKYTLSYIQKYVKPKQLDYQRLVKKWLDIDVNLKCTTDELEAIGSSSFSIVAKNAIKKRASLVRALAIAMTETFNNAIEQPGQALFSLAKRATNEDKEEYDKRDDNTYDSFILTLNLSRYLRELPEHRSLVVEKFGNPLENVALKIRKPQEVLASELEPKQVLVEHLAACVNPADLNVVQGVYGRLPELPSIIGNEGITRVKFVGSQVTTVKPGDFTLHISGGYWQSYSIQHEDHLYKVDNNLDVTIAAQLKVNPCTAYRMLKDFSDMKEGDTFIQNGANSAVGVYAIQLAKLWGIKSINIIRDRPDKDKVVEELKSYGANYVLTESELSNIEVTSPILKITGKPKLFLDCVGGKNANNCQRTLEQGGYIVTYGAMSRQPYSIPASALIFKDHKHVGFWVSRWYKEREATRRHEIIAMLEEIGNMFKESLLKPKSSTLIDFEDRNIAFSGSNNTKYIFSINKR